MYPSSSLLTLPLEIRQHIYSYLLINECSGLFLWSYRDHSRYLLSLTCRQLYLEVDDYYFAMNVFRLSLDHFGNLEVPNQLVAWSKRSAGDLELNFRRVQHIQLEMELYDHGQSHPQRMKQAEWVRGALIRARQGSVERCWLRSLDIQVYGTRSLSESWNFTAQQSTDKELVPYKAFLQPFRGMTGKLTFLGQEVMLDD